MRTQIISVVLLLALSGCSFHNPFVPTTEEKIEKAESNKCKLDAKINQQTRQFVTGAKEILESIPKERLNKEEQVSLDLTEQAERLLGGEPIEKMDVNALLTLYDSNDKEKYNQIISEKEKTVTAIKTGELNNETTITALEHQLAKEKAGSSLWNWFKNAGVSAIILMILGFVLLLIFAPNVLGWLITKIPSLVLYLGVTSSRVVTALVKGVQKARAQIAELPDNAKLDKYEILDMIDRGLKEEADSETTNTVKVLRDKYNLESISQKLKVNIANVSKKDRINKTT